MDGTEWKQVADIGTSNRASPSMVYDSSKKEMLLFGGVNQTDYFGDTWTMKNNAWTKVQDMGLGPLAFADMVHTGSRAVLFGGYDQTVLNHDTWDWKDSLWTQRQNMGPTIRAFHSIAYDSERNCIVMFGGYDGNMTLNDTWELTVTQ